VFLAEGYRQLDGALTAGARVLEVYAAPELYLGEKDRALVALAARRGARVIELSAEAFTSISGQVRPDGLAAVIERPPTDLDRLQVRSLLLVAAGIERPRQSGRDRQDRRGSGRDWTRGLRSVHGRLSP